MSVRRTWEEYLQTWLCLVHLNLASFSISDWRQYKKNTLVLGQRHMPKCFFNNPLKKIDKKWWLSLSKYEKSKYCSLRQEMIYYRPSFEKINLQ